MKKLFFPFLFVLFYLSSSAQSSSERKVAEAVDVLTAAMISGDKDQLNRLLSDQLSYGHSGGAIDTKEILIENLSTRKSDFVTIDISDQTISVSGKTAIVRHLLKAKINDLGKPGDVNLKVLLIWQKTGGKWKLLARQAVKAV